MADERISDLIGVDAPETAVEVADRIWMAVGTANAYKVATPEGSVMIDAGLAGWFTYRSALDLYATPPEAVYPDVVDLAGADALVARSEERLAACDRLEAMHLAGMVLASDAGHIGALSTKLSALRSLYEQYGQRNFQEAGWYRAEIAQVERELEAAQE